MQLINTKIIKATHPGSTVAQIYNQGYNRGIGCNMHPVSFSLVRFFWTSKRNEQKLSRAAESPMLTRDCPPGYQPVRTGFILRSDGKENERNKRNERKPGSEVLVNCCPQIIIIPASNPFVRIFISISWHQNGTKPHYITKITNMQPAQTFAFFSTFTNCNTLNQDRLWRINC